MIELGLGVGIALLALAARYALNPLLGDIAPYAFNFAAVTLATIVGGWRAGGIALIVGQSLTFMAIVEPVGSFTGADARERAGFIVSTTSQLILLVALALYQREVDKGTAEREKRLALQNEALKEIDHRTRNNYQTVLAMIDLQARRASDDEVRKALQQVSDRIQAVANVSAQLALRSAGLDAIRLDDHLCELVTQIERGLSHDGIKMECEVDEVTTSPDTATSISIIVNELVTNAVKHAFNGEERGQVKVTGRAGRAFELIVADNGRGFAQSKRNGPSGLGSKLVESFARQLHARHEVQSSEGGTTHRLLFPHLD